MGGFERDVGPFSVTAAGWIEGGSSNFLPGGIGSALPGARRPELLPESAAAGREPRISVLVVDAMYQSLHQREIVQPALEMAGNAVREARRIEGPGVEEAA